MAPRINDPLRRVGGIVALAGALGWAGGCGAAPAAPAAAAPPAAAPVDPASPRSLEELDLETRPFPLPVWVAHMVTSDYVDRGRLDPRAQLSAALDAIALARPEPFVSLEGDVAVVRVAGTEARVELGRLDDLYDAAIALEGVLVAVRDQLELGGPALRAVEYAAVNGFLAPLDPHTILLTPDETADLGVRTRGHFGGVGVEVHVERGTPVVLRILADSPAARAGLLAGDVIVQVDGRSTVNLGVMELQSLLRGPVGTEVTLTIKRGKARLRVAVTREQIRIESVRAVDLGDGVAYLKINQFQEDTTERFAAELEARREGSRALILDLRDNGGGLLTEGIAVLDELLGAGELLVVDSAAGRETQAATATRQAPASWPIVVLIDEASASASEVVAGALARHGRAVIIGRSSFGKGSIQVLRHATPYGEPLALKLTVAEYRTSAKQAIQGRGVAPDVELIPVQVGPLPGIVRYFDDERFEREREHGKLAAAGRAPSARPERPRAGLRLFYDDTPRGAPGWAAEAVEVAGLLADPELALAAELARSLAQAGQVAPAPRALAELLEPALAREQATIRDRLAAAGVDWDEGPAGDEPPGPGALELGLSLRDGPVVVAERPFALELTVTNTSARPIHGVHARTRCAQDQLDGIEVAIGRLEPGQVHRRSLELSMPAWLSRLVDHVQVDVRAGDRPEPLASERVVFELSGPSGPRLAWDWWIVDDPELARRAPPRPGQPDEADEFVVAGNGDGLLQPGERVLVVLRVTNLGEGPARDPRAVFRNLTGDRALLEEGELAFGPLAPGQAASGAVGLTVASGADPARTVELDVNVGDTRARVSTRRRLGLTLDRGAAFERGARTVVVGAEGAIVRNAADRDGAALAELAPGTALPALGAAGRWLAVDGGPGRRLWVPDDAVTTAGEPAAGPWQPPVSWPVLAPTIAASVETTTTQADRVLVRGSASHPRGVVDVSIQARAEASRGPPSKRGLVVGGRDRRSLEFEQEVPLEPGSNRITILARDPDEVVARYDLWVYRR